MISEEEKQAIEYLNKYINWETYGERSLETDIETVLNLIETQNKMIELMAEEFLRLDSFMGDYDNHTIETLIEYFRNQAKESEDE